MVDCTRRNFIKKTSVGLAGASIVSSVLIKPALTSPHRFQQQGGVSLATWSLNRTYAAGLWTLKDIHRICREEFNIGGVEYVTHFFIDVRDFFLKDLNKAAEDYGVTNVLIMVDREGDMVSTDKRIRKQAAINHRKWVEIAAYLGCHAIRCNATVAFEAGGSLTFEEDPESIERAAESFNELLEYAKEFNIKILIEPHGSKLSTNPRWLVALAKKLNNPNFGLLPDFLNFSAEKDEELYEAVRLTMPYAKGVSVKGAWYPDGRHRRGNLETFLQIAKESGYKGWWGIESSIRRESGFYESASAEEIKKDEWQAVKWTKAAIDNIVFS